MDERLTGTKPTSASCLFWSYISEANTGITRPWSSGHSWVQTRIWHIHTYTVWFSSHVQTVSLKFTKMLEEYSYECGNIFSSLFRGFLERIIYSSMFIDATERYPPLSLRIPHKRSQYQQADQQRRHSLFRSMNKGWNLPRSDFRLGRDLV